MPILVLMEKYITSCMEVELQGKILHNKILKINSAIGMSSYSNSHTVAVSFADLSRGCIANGQAAVNQSIPLFKSEAEIAVYK